MSQEFITSAPIVLSPKELAYAQQLQEQLQKPTKKQNVKQINHLFLTPSFASYRKFIALENALQSTHITINNKSAPVYLQFLQSLVDDREISLERIANLVFNFDLSNPTTRFGLLEFLQKLQDRSNDQGDTNALIKILTKPYMFNGETCSLYQALEKNKDIRLINRVASISNEIIIRLAANIEPTNPEATSTGREMRASAAMDEQVLPGYSGLPTNAESNMAATATLATEQPAMRASTAMDDEALPSYSELPTNADSNMAARATLATEQPAEDALPEYNTLYQRNLMNLLKSFGNPLPISLNNNAIFSIYKFNIMSLLDKGLDKIPLINFSKSIINNAFIHLASAKKSDRARFNLTIAKQIELLTYLVTNEKIDAPFCTSNNVFRDVFLTALAQTDFDEKSIVSAAIKNFFIALCASPEQSSGQIIASFLKNLIAAKSISKESKTRFVLFCIEHDLQVGTYTTDILRKASALKPKILFPKKSSNPEIERKPLLVALELSYKLERVLLQNDTIDTAQIINTLHEIRTAALSDELKIAVLSSFKPSELGRMQIALVNGPNSTTKAYLQLLASLPITLSPINNGPSKLEEFLFVKPDFTHDDSYSLFNLCNASDRSELISFMADLNTKFPNEFPDKIKTFITSVYIFRNSKGKFSDGNLFQILVETKDYANLDKLLSLLTQHTENKKITAEEVILLFDLWVKPKNMGELSLRDLKFYASPTDFDIPKSIYLLGQTVQNTYRWFKAAIEQYPETMRIRRPEIVALLQNAFAGLAKVANQFSEALLQNNLDLLGFCFTKNIIPIDDCFKLLFTANNAISLAENLIKKYPQLLNQLINILKITNINSEAIISVILTSKNLNNKQKSGFLWGLYENKVFANFPDLASYANLIDKAFIFNKILQQNSAENIRNDLTALYNKFSPWSPIFYTDAKAEKKWKTKIDKELKKFVKGNEMHPPLSTTENSYVNAAIASLPTTPLAHQVSHPSSVDLSDFNNIIQLQQILDNAVSACEQGEDHENSHDFTRLYQFMQAASTNERIDRNMALVITAGFLEKVFNNNKILPGMRTQIVLLIMKFNLLGPQHLEILQQNLDGKFYLEPIKAHIQSMQPAVRDEFLAKFNVSGETQHAMLTWLLDESHAHGEQQSSTMAAGRTPQENAELNEGLNLTSPTIRTIRN